MRYSEFRIRLIELNDAVRRQTAERWRKENPQLTDAQINYYLDNWDRYSQGFETQYKDITRLTFAQVEQLIDHAQARAELKGKAKPEQKFDQNDDMIYNRNNLVVLKGDLREKCIQYGQGYSWCISRTDASNMFYSYRMRKDEPMFYFVFDKDRPKDDVWHAVVIYVDNDQVIHVATADNPGDEEMTWEQIVTKQPKLRGLEQLFVPQPLSPDERRDYEKFKDERSLESYVAMPLKDKIKYIKFGHELTAEQQAATEDVDLLGLYAKGMPTRITKDTFRRIKSGDRRKMISDLLQQDEDWHLIYFANSVATPWHRMGLPEDVVDRAESRIAKKPRHAFLYAHSVIKGRWSEGEPNIAEDPPLAFKYARDVIKGPFPEAEPVIAEDHRAAFEYARDVIKGRFPEAEPVIAKESWTAFKYARDVIRGPWPEAEPEIAKEPVAAFDYALDVMDGRRFPEAEPEIAKEPSLAFEYARDVIKGRFPEAESEISKRSWTAFKYARDVIQRRFPEGEPVIAKDPPLALEYARDVIKGPWPEAEPEIAKRSSTAFLYARDVIKGRWPEAESEISKNPWTAFRYARDVIRGPWPEAGIDEIQ